MFKTFTLNSGYVFGAYKVFANELNTCALHGIDYGHQ